MTTEREGLCDSHAHLYFPKLVEQVSDVLRRAAQAGVTSIVNIGTRPSTNPVAIEQARSAAATAGGTPGVDVPQLYATVGFHPHEAAEIVDEDWPVIERQAAEPIVVGLGEFGLDYHYEHSPRDAQRRVLRRGIELALRVGKPMVIHSRKAGLEVIETLDEVAGRDRMPRGVFHCFTDTWELAEAALERGFYIGITGIVTFPNAPEVAEVAARIPMDRLLVETDAPFCAPVPMRGKTNEPSFVGYVCDRLAALHGIDPQVARRQTTANARRLFGI
ncbi:MAG TPA: TatD family hydrolase [Phycisphaerae bacterium]|nr:TatD family hydrolase [Phycisphaerae bacterium]